MTVYKISDCCYTPVGDNTPDNVKACIDGEFCLKEYQSPFGLTENACLSLFDRNKVSSDFNTLFPETDHQSYTFFEKIACIAGRKAIGDLNLIPDDTLLVLSTTKGNVDALPDRHIPLATSAKKIAVALGLNADNVLTVSNACVSGVCALTTAVDMLAWGYYRHALIIGADVLSAFIVSGFQSFKALSPERCRPYDTSRCGLNLGEAAASMVLSVDTPEEESVWQVSGCANHNDANHISGPSRTAEGSLKVIESLISQAGQPDVINTHGTATLYNDEMESIALHRAGLDSVPTTALKGIFGHTLGAAGVLESILTIAAADNDTILPTAGFGSCGVTYPVNISSEVRKGKVKTVFKILSGFGGSNAGIAFKKDGKL